MCDEDLRFVSSAAVGAAFAIFFVGVVFAGYLTEGKTYVLVSFSIIALLMLAIGSAIRYHAYKEDKRWLLKGRREKRR